MISAALVKSLLRDNRYQQISFNAPLAQAPGALSHCKRAQWDHDFRGPRASREPMYSVYPNWSPTALSRAIGQPVAQKPPAWSAPAAQIDQNRPRRKYVFLLRFSVRPTRGPRTPSSTFSAGHPEGGRSCPPPRQAGPGSFCWYFLQNPTFFRARGGPDSGPSGPISGAPGPQWRGQQSEFRIANEPLTREPGRTPAEPDQSTREPGRTPSEPDQSFRI
jgi:hypothetical protein